MRPHSWISDTWPVLTHTWLITAMCLFGILPASVATAQTLSTPAFEIAAGWHTVNTPDTAPQGWLVSAARPFGDRWAIVVDVGNLSFSRSPIAYRVEENRWHTFSGGIRHAWRRPRVTPFVAAQGGFVMLRSSSTYYDPYRPVELPPLYPQTVEYTDYAGLFQATAGIDIRLASRLSARVSASALNLYTDSIGTSFLKLTAGMVIGLGSR